jgi:chromosomal replication initiation ATPase DnaA
MSMRPAEQLRLKLRTRKANGRAEFIVSASNRAAVDALDAWPAWPGGCVALVGPEGSGKSLLAADWARRAGAQSIAVGAADVSHLTGGAILFEDADRGVADETLFHLITMSAAGGSLLLTARARPKDWATSLPDLRSRLNALVVAEIEEPDDPLLEGLLRKFFRERSIRPSDDVYPYLIRRIERSIPAAKDVVSRLDELAAAGQREITRALARQVFDQEDSTLDLFE